VGLPWAKRQDLEYFDSVFVSGYFSCSFVVSCTVPSISAHQLHTYICLWARWHSVSLFRQACDTSEHCMAAASLRIVVAADGSAVRCQVAQAKVVVKTDGTRDITCQVHQHICIVQPMLTHCPSLLDRCAKPTPASLFPFHATSRRAPVTQTQQSRHTHSQPHSNMASVMSAAL
jgi:hypothetical protein